MASSHVYQNIDSVPTVTCEDVQLNIFIPIAMQFYIIKYNINWQVCSHDTVFIKFYFSFVVVVGATLVIASAQLTHMPNASCFCLWSPLGAASCPCTDV